MAQDEDFKPRIGRMRARPAGRSRTYFSRVLKAANLAGGTNLVAGRRSAFTGARIGRGGAAGAALAGRDRHAAWRHRRVVVKISPKPMGAARAVAGARAHLKYLERDGTTPDGGRGQVYGAQTDRADGGAFMDRCEGDRHQFRAIISPEDGAAYDDLKPFIRRLMARMEEDVGTRLDWVAVDHHNTGHPHTHVLIRGKTERGDDLVIARDYVSHGLRERAVELVSLDLGPRTDFEIEEGLRKQVTQERLTALDRALLRRMDEARAVAPLARDPFHRALQTGRLQQLGRMELAEPIGAGRWRLADGLEDTLRRMGERGDIIRTMQRELKAQGAQRSAGDYAIHEPGSRPITGRLVRRGLADEQRDRHYIIIDGVDGRTHYVDIGKGEATAPIPEGAIVRVAQKPIAARAADRTVAEIAAAHGGRYSIDIHLAHDRSATDAFARAHVRRLEAMRRAKAGVERERDGTWRVAPDHVERAAAYEAKAARAAPVTIETLSALPLDRQVGADGATWLDRELVSGAPEPLRDAGFGAEVRGAQAARRQWLVAQGLADDRPHRTVYRANMLAALHRRELNRVAAQLADETGLSYAEARPGATVEGVYRRNVEMASGRHALIERSREFSLVPWKPSMDRQIGKHIAGVMRGDGTDWTIGRGRGGPSLS
ncbi:DUF3363 domain-containing protein [Glycocaulis profundi]|nr:DUF3363 domain-containing protein [Glycocaulis profundi]